MMDLQIVQVGVSAVQCVLVGLILVKRTPVTVTPTTVPVTTDYAKLHNTMTDLNEQSKDLDKYPVGSLARATFLAKLNAARMEAQAAELALARK